MKRTLTESERNTIANGLRVAAERFKGHCEELQIRQCPDCPDRPGKDGLGHICKRCEGVSYIPETGAISIQLRKQFETQYSDSITLAEVIEAADNVEVTTNPEPTECELIPMGTGRYRLETPGYFAEFRVDQNLDIAIDYVNGNTDIESIRNVCRKMLEAM